MLVIDGLGDLCGNSGYWERGIATGLLLNSSGDNVYGTNLAGEYAPDTKSFFISPCYDLSQTTNPVLKFDMAYDLEENWDVFYVEYSTDGSNWNVLGTSGDPIWYNSDRTLASSGGTDCYNCPGAQWTGTNSAVQQYSHELASLGNPTNITFRFVFHSDQAVEQEGIIIDNLIREITEEFDITTIVISHDMNSVMEISDTISFIHQGQKWWEGSRDDIMNTENQEVVDFVYASNFMKALRASFIKK